MTVASTANFNATTPAAPSGNVNNVFADDGGSPTVNISASTPIMVGDSGSGGSAGSAPAPASGDAAASKFLKADGTWTTPAGAGTVTSVGLSMPGEFSVADSPVTSAGTLTVTKQTQTANEVYAGPASGSAATPAFRALAAADLPLATSSTPGAVQPDDSTITITAGVISAVGGGGSGALTQIAQVVVTTPQSALSFTGIPGTYTNLKLVVQSQNNNNFDEVLCQASTSGGPVDANWMYFGWGGGAAESNNNTGDGHAHIGLSGDDTNHANGFETTIMSYTATNVNKAFSSTCCAVLAGDSSPVIRAYGGEFSTFGVIVALGLTLSNGDDFYTGTVATLYGMQ